jgi:hypothetical protein
VITKVLAQLFASIASQKRPNAMSDKEEIVA